VRDYIKATEDPRHSNRNLESREDEAILEKLEPEA
jgi:hypothetical protein